MKRARFSAAACVALSVVAFRPAVGFSPADQTPVTKDQVNRWMTDRDVLILNSSGGIR
jgi:hypothetical protein